MSGLKHGHSYRGYRSPTYQSWSNMKARCRGTCPHRKQQLYAGITMCEEWFSFENFLRDMGERPKGTSIDRIDNKKGYFKENCRWASQRVQTENRNIRLDNKTTSKYFGVNYRPVERLWKAALKDKKTKTVWCKYFKTEEEAAHAYALKRAEVEQASVNLTEADDEQNT